MSLPSESVCTHMRAEDTCDCCSSKPAIAGESRTSVNDDNLSRRKSLALQLDAEDGRQSVEPVCTVGTASTSYTQLDADAPELMPVWLSHDWERELAQGITMRAPIYYDISADEEKTRGKGGFENEDARLSGEEMQQSRQSSPDQCRKRQAPSLVSFFRLSSDNTSSTSSADYGDDDDSPHTHVGGNVKFYSLRSQNDPLRSEVVKSRAILIAGPTRLSRVMLTGEGAAKNVRRRVKRQAPLARLLSTFSRTCAEASIRFGGLLRGSAEPADPPKRYSGAAAKCSINTESTYKQQQTAVTAPERAIREYETQSTAESHFTEGGTPEECIHVRSAGDSTEFLRTSPAHCPKTAALPLLHCVCSERKRAPCDVLQAIAGAGCRILASATAMAARAAATAAAVIEDDSDNEIDQNPSNFDESDDDTTDGEEMFIFKFHTTPFEFALWASKGSKSLAKSALLTDAHRISSARTSVTAIDSESHEASARELCRNSQHLYRLRAVALRLLLLICQDTPNWFPELQWGDMDFKINTAVSAWAHEECAADAVLEKGIFGYHVRNDLDLLWQSWTGVAVAGQKPSPDEIAYFLNQSEFSQRYIRSNSRHDDEGALPTKLRSGGDIIGLAAGRMLEIDSNLSRLWALKVPKFISDEEFWKQYFYQVYQVMRRFERQAELHWLFSTHGAS